MNISGEKVTNKDNSFKKSNFKSNKKPKNYKSIVDNEENFPSLLGAS